jgi:peptide/nickel transport system ATP-binding protein
VAEVFREPRHPYTLGLLRSVPDFDVVREKLSSIPGAPPDLASPPQGCRFHPRCPYVQDDCVRQPIPLIELGRDRAARCLYHERVAADVRREPVIASG